MERMLSIDRVSQANGTACFSARIEGSTVTKHKILTPNSGRICKEVK